MEKRLPLALFLSFLVLFGWSILFAPDPPPETDDPNGETPAAGVVEPAAAVSAPADVPVPEGAIQAQAESITEPFVLGRPGEPGHYEVRFSNRGASLHSLKFGGYYTRVGLDDAQRADPEHWLPLLEPIETLEGTTGSLLFRTTKDSALLAPADLDRVLWEMEVLREGSEVRGARFTYGPGNGILFTKTITFTPASWHIDVELTIENQSFANAPRRASFGLVPAGCVPPELGDQFYPEPRVIAVPSDGDDAQYEAAPNIDPGESGRLDQVSSPACAGVINKYFAFLLRDAEATQTVLAVDFEAVDELALPGEEVEGPAADPDAETARHLIRAELQLALGIPSVGESRSYRYVAYAGPKAPGEFVEDFEPHARVLESDLQGAGFCGLNFTSIGQGLLAILRWIHALVGNWGVSIILLTLMVRLALFPLNRRSQTAMARYQTKMKRVQPRLDELKKKYENDQQKQREAQARIMQEEGAFPPLGGCLPMFLQMPVFFGLFSMLRVSFDLRQQPFAGWINDLSRPDRLLRIDLELPFVGTIEYFNLLPILMVVMWILQQRGMPQPTDEQAQRMQKMMMFMPIVFGLFLYSYAAGLSLYMLTTSTLGIFEQKVIKKIWPIDNTEQEKKPSGCGPFSGMLENLAEKQKEQLKRMEEMRAQERRQGKGGKKRR